MLSKAYKTTGSDASQVFLDRYKQKNKDADLLKLDAVTIPTERKFDCIFSNKVLQHLTKEELKKSLQRQKEVLNPNGIAFHAVWRGDKIEEKKGGYSGYALRLNEAQLKMITEMEDQYNKVYDNG